MCTKVPTTFLGCNASEKGSRHSFEGSMFNQCLCLHLLCQKHSFVDRIGDSPEDFYMNSTRFIFYIFLVLSASAYTITVAAETKTAAFATDQQKVLQISRGALEFRITREGLITGSEKGILSPNKIQIKLDKGEAVSSLQIAELSDGDLFLTINSDGEAYTGSLLKLGPQLKRVWETNVGVINPLPMLVSGSSVFIGDQSGTTKIDLKTGKTIWQLDPMPDEFLGGTVLTRILISKKDVVIQAEANQSDLSGPIELHLNADSGKQLKIVKPKRRN